MLNFINFLSLWLVELLLITEAWVWS